MNPDSKTAAGPSFARRRFIKAGLAGALTAAGALAPGQVVSSEGEPQDKIKMTPKHRIIDAHNHPRWLGHNGARIVENMDSAGIERTWLLSWEATEAEYSPYYYSVLNPTEVGVPFRDVIDVAERYPDRFICGTTVDPRDPHAFERLRAAVEIHRVRVFGEFKRRMRYDDPDVIRLFHYCGELGLPVVFHLDVTTPRHGVPNSWQWWYGGGLENMEAPLRLCPKTQFLGHAPGFWREISGDADEEPMVYPKGKPVVGQGRIVKFLDRFPNLHCDLSGGSGQVALSRDPAFTRKLLIDYQDRMLFARDQFDNGLMDILLSLNLTAGVLQKILSGNALRLVPV
jgi:predicted TIM-barrel fold metal-dependent hydrolase